MNNKRGLGRGLGALLSSTPTESDTLLEVDIDQVEPNPNQPRKVFDSNALNELSASIKASGVIQPVIVRRQGAGYQLVAGERRWRAARQAGLPRIPAIIREVTDAESLALTTPAEQLKLRDEILAHDWSVRATEDTVRTATAGHPPRPKQRRRSAELAALEETLQRALMTRVRIVGGERQGRIEVAYADADELERLAALLGARH